MEVDSKKLHNSVSSDKSGAFREFTQENTTKSNSTEIPFIFLPKGEVVR